MGNIYAHGLGQCSTETLFTITGSGQDLVQAWSLLTSMSLG